MRAEPMPLHQRRLQGLALWHFGLQLSKLFGRLLFAPLSVRLAPIWALTIAAYAVFQRVIQLDHWGAALGDLSWVDKSLLLTTSGVLVGVLGRFALRPLSEARELAILFRLPMQRVLWSSIWLGSAIIAAWPLAFIALLETPRHFATATLSILYGGLCVLAWLPSSHRAWLWRIALLFVPLLTSGLSSQWKPAPWLLLGAALPLALVLVPIWLGEHRRRSLARAQLSLGFSRHWLLGMLWRDLLGLLRVERGLLLGALLVSLGAALIGHFMQLKGVSSRFVPVLLATLLSPFSSIAMARVRLFLGNDFLMQRWGMKAHQRLLGLLCLGAILGLPAALSSLRSAEALLPMLLAAAVLQLSALFSTLATPLRPSAAWLHPYSAVALLLVLHDGGSWLRYAIAVAWSAALWLGAVWLWRKNEVRGMRNEGGAAHV
jgi:hypothetical protein